jgi:hypothetical protein
MHELMGLGVLLLLEVDLVAHDDHVPLLVVIGLGLKEDVSLDCGEVLAVGGDG